MKKTLFEDLPKYVRSLLIDAQRSKDEGKLHPTFVDQTVLDLFNNHPDPSVRAAADEVMAATTRLVDLLLLKYEGPKRVAEEDARKVEDASLIHVKVTTEDIQREIQREITRAAFESFGRKECARCHCDFPCYHNGYRQDRDTWFCAPCWAKKMEDCSCPSADLVMDLHGSEFCGDGAMAHLQEGVYCLSRSSTATPRGVEVIAAEGGGNWLLMTTNPEDEQSQAKEMQGPVGKRWEDFTAMEKHAMHSANRLQYDALRADFERRFDTDIWAWLTKKE